MSSSWDEAANRIDEAAHAERQRYRQEMDQAAAELRAAQQERADFEARVIRPFINTMLRAGSPGLSWREVPSRGTQKWQTRKCWRVMRERDNSWLDIFPDGTWISYTGSIDVGTGPSAYWTSSYTTYSQIDPGSRFYGATPGEVSTKQYMVKLFRRYGIALPDDSLQTEPPTHGERLRARAKRLLRALMED